MAVFVALLDGGDRLIHFLIRPHLFTFAFVYLTFRVCQKQHERGGWIVAWVPLLTAILANLHGGFLALPVIVATAASAMRSRARWDEARRRNVLKFGLAFVASLPGGADQSLRLGLYRHVGNLLVSSGVTSLINEYQPAPFGKPEADVLEMAAAGAWSACRRS